MLLGTQFIPGPPTLADCWSTLEQGTVTRSRVEESEPPWTETPRPQGQESGQPMGPLPKRRNATVVRKTMFTEHKRTSLGTA